MYPPQEKNQMFASSSILHEFAAFLGFIYNCYLIFKFGADGRTKQCHLGLCELAMTVIHQFYDILCT